MSIGNGFTHWFSALSELEVENTKILTGLFLNIVDGIIIDGTINKKRLTQKKHGLI